MQKLQIIGLGWAADALARMPQLARYPYEDTNFCVLIQTPSCVYKIQKHFVSKNKGSFTHEQYTEPHWQIVPNLAIHKLDKLVLLTEATSWGDLLWLAHLLKLERQDSSTLLLKPYLRLEGNTETLFRKIERFPPQLRIARGRGYNLYVDTPLPDPRDKPHQVDHSWLHFFYMHMERIDRSAPLFPIQMKISTPTIEVPTSVSIQLKFPRKKKKSPEQGLQNSWIIVRHL